MNVVVVSDFASFHGGAERIALLSARGLAQAGHRVFVMSAVGPVAPELTQTEGLTALCTEQPVAARDPNRAAGALRGLWNRRAARVMASLLAALPTDTTVVHAHHWLAALSASVLRVALRRGFTTVVTLHDYQTVCPTGILYDHQRGAACPLKPMSARCIATNCDRARYSHKLWRVLRQAVQERLAGVPSGVHDFISISSFSQSILEPLLPRSARIHRVDNFIDTDRVAPARVGENAVFAYVGRLTREKGPVLFAEAARRLGARTLFIGEGASRGEVLRADPRAEITGWLHPADVAQHLQRARALVFPSLCYETSPLVVAEAAAMGVPAIVSDGPAGRDLIVDGVTGLRFRSGSVEDLIDKIRRLQDPGLAAALGQAAYERFWSAPPTLGIHVAALQTLYAELLARRAAGAMPAERPGTGAAS